MDQVYSYVLREFSVSASEAGVRIIEAPMEFPRSIVVVERYYAPLKEAFPKIWRDGGMETTDEECISKTVFAVNSTAGPEGLFHILLVFGANSRPARDRPAKTQLKRSKATYLAMKEVQRVQSKGILDFGLRYMGPKGG